MHWWKNKSPDLRPLRARFEKAEQALGASKGRAGSGISALGSAGGIVTWFKWAVGLLLLAVFKGALSILAVYILHMQTQAESRVTSMSSDQDGIIILLYLAFKIMLWVFPLTPTPSDFPQCAKFVATTGENVILHTKSKFRSQNIFYIWNQSMSTVKSFNLSCAHAMILCLTNFHTHTSYLHW